MSKGACNDRRWAPSGTMVSSWVSDNWMVCSQSAVVSWLPSALAPCIREKLLSSADNIKSWWLLSLEQLLRIHRFFLCKTPPHK